MLAPAQTSVFGRRLLSFLIDGSLVLAAALAVAWSRAESFAIVERNDAGDAVFSGSDAARLLELDQFELAGFKLARYQELGDTGYAFGEDAIVPAVLIGLLAAFALFALVPMVIGRTVGMVPTGLRIGTTDGERAGVVQHLGRTLLGVVDLIPVAIPGLLGFVLIGLTEGSQRLGDRLTGTTVFTGAKDGSDTPPLSGIVAEPSTPARPTRPARSEDLDDEMVDVADRLDPDLGLDLDLEEIGTDEAVSADTEAQRAVELARAAAAAEVPTARLDDPGHEVGEGLSLPPWAPSGVAPATAHHWGSDTNRDGTPLDEVADEAGLLSDDAFPEVPPPPATRPDRVESMPSAVDGAMAASASLSGDALGAPASLLDTAPLPPPPSHRRSASAAAEAPSSSEQQTATAEFARDEVPVEDVSWDPPVAEPAPVWQPTAYQPETLGEPAPPKATTDPAPAEGRTTAVPPTETAPTEDPTIAEPTIEEPLAAEAPAAAEPVRAEPVRNNTTAPSTPKTANDPVWSDKWGAWLFWDAKGERWLLHDESKDTWIPIS